jgi:hypothetical protein
MNWQLYQLRFQLLSPLHVGRSKIGNIQLARPYVMARHMWGAVTARLTRNALYGQDSSIPANDYVRTGNLVKDQLAFTYFYPEDQTGRPLFPRFTVEGLMYGAGDDSLPENVFTWRYLNSYASTALDYEFNSAEEGTLHEIEYLSPQTRQDNSAEARGDSPLYAGYPVYLTGYVFVKNDCDLSWQQHTLDSLQIGGERKSGWGRLQLCHISGPLSKETLIFGRLQCDLNSSRPRIKAVKNDPLLAHTIVDSNPLPLFKTNGDIEPLVGREWNQSKGVGQDVKHIGVCYVPGSIVTSDSEHWFRIDREYLWQIVVHL